MNTTKPITINQVCSNDGCTGCNACVNICPVKAIQIIDNGLALNAVIDDKLCIRCGACKQVCLNHNEAFFNSPKKIGQGWNTDTELRLLSSSGGFITAIVHFFLDNEASVYSCLWQQGKFVFRKVKDKSDFSAFQGSKYVKSDTGCIFSQISEDIKNNDVLFIGLPCQVQGLKLFLNKKVPKFLNRLTTIDVICHGTPSMHLYNHYLRESGYDIDRIYNIRFRNKNSYQKRHKRKYEYWLSPFLKGLTYTDNCYKCFFARLERVADFTVGDSWGSNLDINEQNRGVSLVLCNTSKSCDLIKLLDFHLVNVDESTAIKHNGQLNHPSAKPLERDIFEKTFLESQNYHYSIQNCYKSQIRKKAIMNSFFMNFVRKVAHLFTSKKQRKVNITFCETIIYDEES